MNADDAPPAAALTRLVNGYQVTGAIHAAVTLGVPDLLAGGPRGVDDLAAAAEADPGALYRLLRALAAVGVLSEDEGRRFALTPVGEGLRSDVPESIAGWARLVGRPYVWEAWSHLVDGVRSGENVFRSLHGESVWDYRAQRPDEQAIFDGAMTAVSRHLDRALLDAFDFGAYGTLVDVGGGRGALLADILARHPAARGVLFDQPRVVAGAGPLLEEAGVADRCRLEPGDFFEAVPEGGDAYLLKAIIHDWEDAEAVAILRNVRRAMADGAALLVLEREVGPPDTDPLAKFSDLNMLVMPGGLERTREEFAQLLAASGFRHVRSVPTASGVSVIEGAPA